MILLKKGVSLKRGLTLIELLITIFIFSIVILLGSSSFINGFISGRLHSSSDKELNRDLNLGLDIVSQKIANANTKVTIGSDTIYGFKVKSRVLAIASIDPNNPSNPQCTFISSRDTDGLLYMTQKACSEFTAIPSTGQLTDRISSGAAKITYFGTTDYLEYNSTTVPYTTIKIVGEDKRNTSITATVQSSYSLNYDTIKRF